MRKTHIKGEIKAINADSMKIMEPKTLLERLKFSFEKDNPGFALQVEEC